MESNDIRTVKVEDKEESKQLYAGRTQQLYELIAFDPNNAQIYQNEVIELNIRLVPHVLKKYKPFGDDEFQLGCLGLIIATKSFDVSKGVPYANYACFCIERELHKAFKYQNRQFEAAALRDGSRIFSLDALPVLTNGDDINYHEQIPDERSQEMFDELLQDHNLTNLFEAVIFPAIDSISKTTKGQSSKVEFDVWRELELSYILEMAQISSQKARLSLSSIAKQLGVSIQNIRIRHRRVIQEIKRQCIELGYLKED